VPAGFPPIPYYRLGAANDLDKGTVPDDVWYQRDADQVLLPPESSGSRDVQFAFRAWLVRLGGARLGPMLSREHRRTVWWMGEAGLRAQVAMERRAIEREFAAVVGELRRAHALTRGEAESAAIRVHLYLSDERGDQRIPLPAFGGGIYAVSIVSR
jgi:hypothetical protein